VIASQADPKLAVTGVWVLPQKAGKTATLGFPCPQGKGWRFYGRRVRFLRRSSYACWKKICFFTLFLIPFENEILAM